MPLLSSLPRFFSLLCLTLLLSSCGLPPIKDRSASVAISKKQALETRLGHTFKQTIAANEGLSGIRALADAHDAFATRALLTLAADKSIDIQYYIWRADTTGLLLLKQLYEAAQRGVRVRILLDDNGIRNLDEILVLVNNHSNIEVRLFNPFSIRFFKPLNYLTEFSRLNHRMHNKSFTVDNMVTIVGGRNIGDEYFGATNQVLFADLDVLAVGTIATEVSKDFDLYWSSPLSYPIEQIVKPSRQAPLSALEIEAISTQDPKRLDRYIQTLKESNFTSDLLNKEIDLEWVKVKMVSDNPKKAEGLASAEDLLTYQLKYAVGQPLIYIDLISPYFVPTKAGVNNFALLMQDSPIRIRVLTNSYETTDVAAVHAGYIKHRKAMLKLGIELYELKKGASSNLTKRKKTPFNSSSSSSLHAKTFTIDGKRVFIGSFNFDPRSAHLNTELGFVIHSPALAEEISTIFSEQVPYSSYQVKLNDKNQLIWVAKDEKDQLSIHTTEPGTSFFSRWWVQFMSALPIEWLL